MELTSIVRGSQLALPLIVLFLSLQLATSNNTRTDIRALEIRSNISYRYARTEIFSKVTNPSNESQEVTFRAVLPETAFVSGFAITVNQQVYKARVDRREEARRQYEQARREGRTAAHVATSARDANSFAVSLNVEAHGKVAFNLTYEELLLRERGRYRMRILLDPGQVVKRLLVEARVHEEANLTMVRVPRLRPSGNEVEADEESEDEPLAMVERPTPRDAIVRWKPDARDQRNLVGGAVRGLLELQYDVDRSAHPNDVLVGRDGYFVHFFAPQGLPPLPKHVVFVLDRSGSMMGRKIQQLQDAMLAILSELKEETDIFSLVFFSSGVQVWKPSNDTDTYEYTTTASLEAIAVASPDNIRSAQAAINNTHARGATHMYSALEMALQLVQQGRESDDPPHEPLVVFLTDGEPNGPNGDPEVITTDMTRTYSEAHVPIYSLAFGHHADFKFLKKLSRQNLGFARKIYEAADTALQLRNFYRLIASPLLSNVTFRYPNEQVDSSTLTKSNFPSYLDGSELAVAGRLRTPPTNGSSLALQANVFGQSGSSGPVQVSEAESIFIDHEETDSAEPTSSSEEEEQDQTPSLERLWAYMTIRQYLDKDHGDNEAGRNDSIDLALRYSFVTPLTSLVVVKPNASDVADLEEASSVSRPQPGSSAPAMAFAPARAGPLGPIEGRTLHRPRMHFDSPRYSRPFTGEHSATSGLVAPRSRNIRPLQRVPYSFITWINATTTPNETTVLVPQQGVLRSFRVGDDQAVDGNITCQLPQHILQQNAHCRHFRQCPLNVFQLDIAQFLPFFCSLGEFLGVCCPDSLYSSSPFQ